MTPHPGLTFPSVTSSLTATIRRPRPAGRPRKAGLDAAILEATRAELARVGYSRMSVETIAHLAGTTKPTIYARYPSKAALATAALESLRRSTPRHPSGDVRQDLIEELTLFREEAARAKAGSLLGAVLVERYENPELLRLFRRHVVQPRRQNLCRILQAARDAGQLDPNADIELAITMLVGSLYASHMAGKPVGRDWPQRLTDAWLRRNSAPRGLDS
jgi:AcrR family transcriptional regulator